MRKMKTIYKYPLEAEDWQAIKMPRGAEILAVQTQGETPCLWALVDTENDSEERYLRVIGTGHPISSEDKYLRFIGTFQLMGGSLVFHVFEVEGR